MMADSKRVELNHLMLSEMRVWRNHVNGRAMLLVTSVSGNKASCMMTVDEARQLAAWLVENDDGRYRNHLLKGLHGILADAGHPSPADIDDIGGILAAVRVAVQKPGA